MYRTSEKLRWNWIFAWGPILHLDLGPHERLCQPWWHMLPFLITDTMWNFFLTICETDPWNKASPQCTSHVPNIYFLKKSCMKKFLMELFSELRSRNSVEKNYGYFSLYYSLPVIFSKFFIEIWDICHIRHASLELNPGSPEK